MTKNSICKRLLNLMLTCTLVLTNVYVSTPANVALAAEEVDEDAVSTTEEPKIQLENLQTNDANPEENLITEGSCGENATWKLTEDGELIISGTGEMDNYSGGAVINYPWRDLISIINKVTIMNGITSIGDLAFYYCTNISDVTIPEGVTSIGNNAFSGCSYLTSIIIPNSLTFIGRGAFSDCRSLISLTIPDGVTDIGSNTFSGCSGLNSLNIPDSVTSIGGSAFEGCRSLTSLTIPDGVLDIESSVFEGCSSLESINIPEGVTSIGGWAFSYCSSLTSIIIPASVTSIGNRTFFGCSCLEEIIVDEANAVYDSRYNCNAIINTSTKELIVGCQNTIIPNNVTSIRDWAFSGCSSLTSITIPASVMSIGYAAFYGCGLLEDIIVDTENPVFDSRDNCNAIIETNTNTLILGCKNTVIPNSVTSIGDYAFSGCTGLNELIIPPSVNKVSASAFWQCYGIHSIEMPYIEWTADEIYLPFLSTCSLLNTIVFTGNIPIVRFWDNSITVDTPLLTVYYPKDNPTYTEEARANLFCRRDSGQYLNVTWIPYVPSDLPSIGYDTQKVYPGDEFTVDVNIKNNPGIAGLVISLDYDDDVYELVGYEDAGLFDYAPEVNLNYVWEQAQNVTTDGKLISFTFKVADDVASGNYPIEIKVRQCKNADLEDVRLYDDCSPINVKKYTVGDADDNDIIEVGDVILIRQYLAAYDYDLEESSVSISKGADANEDGLIDLNDVVLLRQYLAAYDYETGTSTVILGKKEEETS